MLEVGNRGMTVEEEKIHFVLWSTSKAPLLISCDITKISKSTFDILMNPEVIAINQDPLGSQGKKQKLYSQNKMMILKQLLKKFLNYMWLHALEKKSNNCQLTLMDQLPLWKPIMC